jgi:hypothetical protein
MVVFRPGLVFLPSAMVLLAAACTEPTPGYCNLPSHPCPAQLVCAETHTCVASVDTGTGGSRGTGGGPADAGQVDDGLGGGDGSTIADGPDAAADVPPDAPTGCTKNEDCTDLAAPVCERSTGKCVGCLVSDTDCKGTDHVCDPATKTCVGCLTSQDCTVKTTPVCDGQACRGCRADSECAAIEPGVCMSHEDGRCATADETIYVKRDTSICSMSRAAGGTKDVPYCLSQDGLDAMTAARRLVVMRGPDALTEFMFSQAGARVTVVGQGGAIVSPGAHVGVQVSAGTVYLRDLTIKGGSDTGVVADGSGELHMDRCMVRSNTKGGIQVSGAGFEIINTIVDGNGSTSTAGCGTWGGICVNAAGTLTVARFLNDTVVNNMGPGVACVGATTIIAGSIVSGNIPQEISLCTMTPCCAAGQAPMLSSDDHLTSASTACIDKLDPSPLVPDDIDGRPRSDAKSDCGADEYGN